MHMPAAPTSHRLFLALWPPQALRGELQSHVQSWRWPRGARCVAAERLHMTLHFIGEFPADRLPELKDRLAVPFEPFELKLALPEVWHRGLAVLCAEALPDALRDLYLQLGQALLACGVPVEQRPFRPHITLARKAQGALPPPVPLPPLQWRVDQGYALMRSLPTDGGYERMQQFGP